MRKIFPYTAVLLFAIVALLVDFSNHKWKRNEVFGYDVFGYHNYLPALFIYHDITEYKFIDSIERKYKPTGNSFYKYGLYKAPQTKNLCNQYPMGVALFQLPLFSIAHIWATITKQDIADGYSSPYQHATVFSTLLFALLGLILLTSFLKNYFSNLIVFITILSISFGTNFFQYATLESGFSHVYIFFLYCAILYLSEKWYKNATIKNSILLGICIGLCAITRPIDILSCLIPLCWYNPDIPKWPYLKENWRKIALIVIVTFITLLPQLIYWKYVTNQWIYYSYSQYDFFEFDRFRVIHGLFSYRKGWFIYTPLALIAVVMIFFIPKDSKLYFYQKLSWIFFIPMVYLVFSWHNWFYGGSFGCRALIQTLPLLAIPLALFIDRSFTKKIVRKIIVSITLILLISLNLFQTWQYNKNIIHYAYMNEVVYWQVFLSTKNNPQAEKNLQLQEQMDWNAGW